MFSATAIASFLACRHTATLARAESKDEITKPFFKDLGVGSKGFTDSFRRKLVAGLNRLYGLTLD